MQALTRRGFVPSATAAAATFGLDGPIEFLAPASAQAAGPRKTKIGDVEMFSIYDGFLERPLNEQFVKNANFEEVKAAASAAGNPEGKISIPVTTTALRTGGRTILIDAGTGGQLVPTANKFLENLKAAGIEPSSVTTILISHFHADHIFGLMAKENSAQIFPHAEILVPEVEYKHWTDPALIEKLPENARAVPKRIQATFPNWKNIKQFAWGKEVAPGITAMETPGHTPGHTSFLIASGNQQLIVQGDVTNVPQLFVKNPSWHASFDNDGAKAEATRRKLYDQVVADKTMIAGYHWGPNNVGTIAKDGAGYVFTPAA